MGTGKVITITKAEVKTTQYGPLAVFTTSDGLFKSFNKAPLSDAEAIVAGKIALPKAVKVVQAKSGKSGRQYIALEEA